MALKDSFLLPQQLCKHVCAERPQARAFHFHLIEYGCYGMKKLQSLIPITQNWIAKIMQVFFTQVSRHHGNPVLKLTYIAPESNHGSAKWVLLWEANSTLPSRTSRTHVSQASGRGDPWTTKFIVAICSQLGKLKLRIQWLLQTTPKNIPKGTECYTWCCVKRHWWAKKRSQKTPGKRVARQTVKPNPKNWGLFWEMECTQNPIRRMVLLNPSHLETSTQSFVQPRCNIQGHGMSLLKCCTEDMTLYSDTSQGDVYM